jgi:hypothetical protein
MRPFAEQLARLTRRGSRVAGRSEPLRAMLTSIGMALAGRAGVRLAAKVGSGVLPFGEAAGWPFLDFGPCPR